MTIYKKLNPEELESFKNDYYNTRMSKKELLEKYQIGIWGYSQIRLDIPKRKHNAPSTNLIKLNERYFENINTPDKAYWLGFIAADGCIKLRNEKYENYILSIGLGQKDSTHLNKLKKCLDYEGTLKTETCLHSKTKKYYTTVYLRIARTILCEDLIKQGIGRDKSEKLKLPDLSDDLMRHYLRGLIDGDGGWYIPKTSKQIVFSFISSIEQFTLDVRNYLKNKCLLENSPGLIFYRNSYAFSYHGNIQCKRIFEYLYNDCETYLDRKYELCKNHFANLKGNKSYNRKEKEEILSENELLQLLGEFNDE